MKKPESQKKPKKSEKEQIDQLIELIEDQHADNQKIGDRVEQMGQATVNHLNELYTFIKNETKILKDDNKVLKDDNKVLKDKIKALEDKAKKAEAFNNEALMGKITEVGTAVGDLAKSDTPIEETTSVKKTIRELAEEVKRSNRSVAECARIGEKFDNFLRDNQSPRARRDSKRQRRDKRQSPPPGSTVPNPPAPAPTLIVPTTVTPQTGATTPNLPQSNVQAGPQVIREGNLATTVMGQNGRAGPQQLWSQKPRHKRQQHESTTCTQQYHPGTKLVCQCGSQRTCNHPWPEHGKPAGQPYPQQSRSKPDLQQ